MKKLITVILSLAALALATQARSVTIAGIENVTLLDGTGTVSASSASNFFTVSSTTSTVASNSTVTEVLTDTDSFAMATFVLETNSTPNPYIDITFGDTVTGANDLVFFFFGGNDDAAGTSFSNPFALDINLDGNIDTNNSNTNHFLPKDNGLITEVLDLDWFRLTGKSQYFALTAATVDLSTAGLAFDQSLDTFRLFLGDGTDQPLLAGIGYLPGVAVIPLPLPIILFASGLGVLGLFGRRKTH